MPESANKALIILVYCVLALGTLLIFWQVTNFDFTNYDDYEYVTQNQHVLNGLSRDGFIWAFTTSDTGYWHPLTWLSFMLDCQLFGPKPGLIHLVSLLLHVANVLLLFTVLKKMTSALWPSAFVAAAFAIHPMHVESVAWIAERKDMLSTFFWLLTMAAYVGYVRRGGLFRYLLTILLFALGLMAKPMAVSLPFVLLLCDYWPLKRLNWRAVFEKIPFFALSAVLATVTFLLQRSSGAMTGIKALSMQSRFSNACLSYAAYIGKLFWPQNLAVFYPFDESAFSLRQIALCAMLLLAISASVIYLGRSQKFLPVGWFWFVGMLVPVIGIVQVGEQSYADRYTYIPYIGLFIMIAWGLGGLFSNWRYRKIFFGICIAVVLTAAGMCAYRQVEFWKNSSTLFLHALAVTKDNYLAHYCLGDDLLKHGNSAGAIEHFKKSLEIRPNYKAAFLGMGYALGEQGDANEAIECFQKVLLLKPTPAQAAYAHHNLGVALQKQGKFTEAAAHLNQAIEIMPDFAEASYDLGIVFLWQGKLDQACDKFRDAHRLKPDWPEPINGLASLTATHPELKNRDVNEAVSLGRRACELTNYKNPVFLGTLAAAYASAGRFSEAIETANTALSFADANQAQIKNIIRRQLTLYTQGKPYVEPPAAPNRH
jgi:tetratricopeptide (TPR) repeat protein